LFAAIVVGTRPNFIKVTQFQKELENSEQDFEFKLIHTGQHYDKNMSDIFFEQFSLKKPDVFLNIKGLTPAAQIGEIIIQLSKFLEEYQPDILIVPGDVNSTMAATIAANKTGIRLAHLESGLRSFDREMPEELNRLVTDVLADDFFVTEQSGLDNIAIEPSCGGKVHFVGNTMIDTLVAFEDDIEKSPILEELKVSKGKYVLMTMHRPSNVDTKEKLLKLIDLIDYITETYNLAFPIHPRTKKNLEKFDLFDRLENNSKVLFTPPLDYMSFQKLIKYCKFILTDSGGIQEESTFRQVPCLTLRENTERPSTLTLGSNTLVPFDVNLITSYIEQINNGTYKKGEIPPFWDGKATQRIVEILAKEL
jgi:UDP-N-acetylglucosamine 2-epimerase (non-hydrolysing)